MHKSATRDFQWKGRIETLEDRRVMSADPLLGVGIEHHFFEEAPPLEHQIVSEPDFWLDTDNLISIDDQLEQIEQTLYSAHNTTGLNSVVSNYGFTGIGQTVAVIDSGIAYDHFALGGGFGSNYRVVGGWDFTGENDANPYDDGPEGSHGTHVAGIIGGSSGNDKGVAPGVDLVALRVFDDAGAGYFSWVENALDWVIANRNSFENPITAINLSLGVASWNSNTIPSWATLEDEFAALEAAGVFIAVSAGNSYASYNTPGLSYPAASPYVVPVMSVTDGGSLASYSQRDTRAIAAPGSAIRSTVPDYVGNNNGLADDYATYSGTSMASPYIAGASVLVRQAMDFVGYTNITQDMIYDHMMATGTSFFDSATSQWYKRLNLGAAIDALMPTDDYGSSLATAYNFGSLSGSESLSGVISTLADVDYFTFTASVNGNVSFAVSNATHEMDAAWNLSYGTGTLSNNGDTFSFDVVAGQSYTVGLSSSGGLGYYDLDVTAESTFTYTDWGTIAFSQLNNLSNSGETWYRVAAGQAGYLTVESMFNAGGGQINLELYNASMQLVDSGNPISGTSRVDAYATAGQEFYLCVLGTNADVDYRLSNLVSVSGTTVNVAGTAGADTFTFAAGSTHSLSVNSVTHTFDSVAVNAFNFNGGAGSDTITMTGTGGDETATLRVGDANLTGTGYTARALAVETLIVNGGGGSDEANLYDSTGNDRFDSKGVWARLSGADFDNVVNGFGRIIASGSGGYDTAKMYDTAGKDVFTAKGRWAQLAGDNYSAIVKGFDEVAAFSSAGEDVAKLLDTTQDDVATLRNIWSRMSGVDYLNYVEGFRQVAAYSTVGNDVAFLYDSPGDDQYEARSNWATMKGTGFLSYAEGFSRTYGYASNGNDLAFLYDSDGDDSYVVKGSWANMKGAGYQRIANGFDRTYGYASTGNDVAEIHDTAGNDVFTALGSWSRVTGANYYVIANGFRSMNAFSTSGYDQAIVYDTAGDDHATGLESQATIYGDGYEVRLLGYALVTAYSQSGGNDTAELVSLDYVFELIGGWS